MTSQSHQQWFAYLYFRLVRQRLEMNLHLPVSLILLLTIALLANYSLQKKIKGRPGRLQLSLGGRRGGRRSQSADYGSDNQPSQQTQTQQPSSFVTPAAEFLGGHVSPPSFWVILSEEESLVCKSDASDEHLLKRPCRSTCASVNFSTVYLYHRKSHKQC